MPPAETMSARSPIDAAADMPFVGFKEEAKSSEAVATDDRPALDDAHEGTASLVDGVPSNNVFAQFRNIYSSRDGSLAVYEDKDGHLTAVDTSKLA